MPWEEAAAEGCRFALLSGRDEEAMSRRTADEWPGPRRGQVLAGLGEVAAEASQSEKRGARAASVEALPQRVPASPGLGREAVR